MLMDLIVGISLFILVSAFLNYFIKREKLRKEFMKKEKDKNGGIDEKL